MRDDTGVALYGKAGELGMPVGVMCFKGFGLHVKEIEALLLSSPRTKACSMFCTISLVFTIIVLLRSLASEWKWTDIMTEITPRNKQSPRHFGCSFVQDVLTLSPFPSPSTATNDGNLCCLFFTTTSWWLTTSGSSFKTE